MERYKVYLDEGDIMMTKSTARRYNIHPEDLTAMETEQTNIIERNYHDEMTDPTPSLIFNKSNDDNDDYNCDDNDDYNCNDDDYFNDLSKIINDVNHKENANLYLKPKSLQDFISSKDFYKRIITKINKTIGEVFFMILKYSNKNGLSTSAMTELFQLINNLFETPILPDSKYMTDKLLNPKSGTEFHAVCQHCSAYLGQFGTKELKNICDNCNCKVNTKNPSDESFFALIDPSKQISDLLTTYEEHYDSVITNRVSRPGFLIEDVYDGDLYRKFFNSLSEEERSNFVTAVFNTDGAPKFKCSQRSIWPLYLMINELPKQDRMKKLICCGLWFNRKKPNMLIFLDKFVDMINQLRTDGISCKIKNEERFIKLYILSCCVDSVARAPVQGIKQFNGHYGCNWCLHPGKYDEAMVYGLTDTPLQHRNHIETVQLMLNAYPKKPVFGVKYPSPLINLPAFDIIDGFVPDYMHCCLEGVASQMLSYYVDTLSEDEIAALDLQMDKISAPHQVARLTRRISCRNDWKAREWENWILFYSTPVLSSVISKIKLDHWLLFVEGLYILLQDCFCISDLNRADEMFYKFVSQVEELYGIRAMTFNVHLLLHIGRSVFNWGPLYINSTFCFESANRHLLNAIKCSRGVAQQIARYLNINHSILSYRGANDT